GIRDFHVTGVQTCALPICSMHAKVFDRKAKEFPALYIGSKVPWLGIHERGGTIRGRMLVPLLPQHRRIGRKAFARVIDALMRSRSEERRAGKECRRHILSY